MEVDLIGQRYAIRPDRCELPDGHDVALSFASGEPRVDATLTVRRGQEVVAEIRPEPRTPLRGNLGGVGHTLACDSEIPRFYYGHPVHGYVVAYDVSGLELWRQQVEPFRPLDLRADLGLQEILAALARDRSTLTLLSARGSCLLAEFGTGGVGRFHVVFHRSGAVLGSMGPWDGLVLGPGPDGSGWTLLSGGGLDLRFFVPRQRQTLRPPVTRLDSVVDHAIAWLTPRPVERQLAWTPCDARPVDEVRHWLGAAYVEADSLRARTALGARDPAWFADFLERDPLPDVAGRFDPTDPAWVDDYRHALYRAGIDVLVREWLRE